MPAGSCPVSTPRSHQTLLDVLLASEYGGVLLAVGLLYWMFSGDTERYRPIAGIVAFGMLLNALINAYWWLVGHYTLQNALFNIVANTGLAVWFLRSCSLRS